MENKHLIAVLADLEAIIANRIHDETDYETDDEGKQYPVKTPTVTRCNEIRQEVISSYINAADFPIYAATIIFTRLDGSKTWRHVCDVRFRTIDVATTYIKGEVAEVISRLPDSVFTTAILVPIAFGVSYADRLKNGFIHNTPLNRRQSIGLEYRPIGKDDTFLVNAGYECSTIEVGPSTDWVSGKVVEPGYTITGKPYYEINPVTGAFIEKVKELKSGAILGPFVNADYVRVS